MQLLAVTREFNFRFIEEVEIVGKSIIICNISQ